MPHVSARVEMALGGSFFAKMIEAFGSQRVDYRMGLTIEDASTHNTVVRNSNASVIVPDLNLIRGPRITDNVSDRDNATSGIIPEGGQGVQLRSAEQEFLIADLPDMVPNGSGYLTALVWLGTVQSLPTANVPVAYVRGGSGAGRRFGLGLSTTGQFYSIHNNTLSDVTAALPAVDQPVYVVLVKNALVSTATTLSLFVNGVLVDTASVTNGEAFGSSTLVLGADQDTSMVPVNFYYDAGLDATVYYFGLGGNTGTYDELTTQIAAQYAALQWTDITDVLRREPVSIERGIRDDSVVARVASTGIASFHLNNAVNNSGGKQGYYTPGHVNCRPGFGDGIPVRIFMVPQP